MLDAVTQQGARPLGLEAPLGRLAVGARNRHDHPGMGVGVLEVLHRAGDVDLF